MIWEKQSKKQYCLIDNRKLCANRNLCCSFCRKKDCMWRCSDDCARCRFITDEIAYFGNEIPTISKDKVLKNTSSKETHKLKYSKPIIVQVKKQEHNKHGIKHKRKLL